MKRPPQKLAIEISHAAIRAAQRYGIVLTWADLRELAELCRTGDGCTGTDPETGCEQHAVVFRDRVLFVVYKRRDKLWPRGLILTVLPKSQGGIVALEGKLYRQRRRGMIAVIRRQGRRQGIQG